MFKDREKYFEIEEFKNFGVKALFTTKAIGDTDLNLESGQENLKKFFETEKLTPFSLVWAKQTHSANIIDIKNDTCEFFYEDVDGFITQRKDVILITKHADCLPIYFYDTVNKVIGICHSGWKGSFQEIGIKVIEKMNKNYGSLKENILIGIGIGISMEKYEVGDEFYENFKSKFSEDLVDCSFSKIDERWHFDNVRFNLENFKKYGISPKNIIVSDECTFKNPRFSSFRRDKNLVRNIGAIFLF